MAAASKRKPLSEQQNLGDKFIFWDMDPTGRRLIDEMCQIALYTPQAAFRQYIMPHRDVDLISKKRHQIRTVTVGRYRVLKDTKQGRILKTKSELYALLDFLSWIDTFKGKKTEKVVLINFEQYKLAPCLLIEALKRYNLLDRFSESVSGFANAYPFVKQKCELSMSSFSLRTLAKVLLNKEHEETFSAHNRARLSYEIVEHLCAGDAEDDAPPILKAVMTFFNSVEEEQAEIDEFKLVLEKQNTLKPIFGSLLKNPKTRKRAATLRRYLTNSKLCYEDLKNIWEGNKTPDEIEDDLSTIIEFEEHGDKTELMKILTNHFNNEEKSVPENEQPVRGYNKKNFKNKKFMKFNRPQQVVGDPAAVYNTPEETWD